MMMAMAETLAHANWLVAEGKACRIETKDAVRFARA
jgi:hypothetical protein